MNYQIYKLAENDKWIKSELEDIKTDDIIRVFDLDTGVYETNYDKSTISIVVRGAYQDKEGLWSIDSKPYEGGGNK